MRCCAWHVGRLGDNQAGSIPWQVTWSPQGRIHQIEYAMEAVKQGAAAVGLRVSASTSIPPHRLDSLMLKYWSAYLLSFQK